MNLLHPLQHLHTKLPAQSEGFPLGSDLWLPDA